VSIYSFDDHVEFAPGRVKCGLNLISYEDCGDEKGHGTHTAATIAGVTYGAAKKAQLIKIKSLDKDGVGSASSVIVGLDYVVKEKEQNPGVPMIVNLSLGSSYSPTLNEAVHRAVDHGIVVIAAAGNKGVDACTKSPASSSSSITVGATNEKDESAAWSNWGSCVDIYAYVIALSMAFV
jgi:subtilisin family serine protease